MTKRTKIILGIVAGLAILIVIGMVSGGSGSKPSATTAESVPASTETVPASAQSSAASNLTETARSIGSLEVTDFSGLLW